MIAPPWFAVPPDTHGGIENLVATLTGALTDLGVDCVLYAAGDGVPGVLSRSVFSEPQSAALYSSSRGEIEALHVSFSYDDAIRTGADVFHDHSGRIGAAVGAATGRPVVHTVHGLLTEEKRRLYRQLTTTPAFHLAAVSSAQRESAPELRFTATIHNALDLSTYTYQDSKSDNLLFVGRILPGKGVDRAIAVARETGRPLVIAGMLEPTALAKAYFHEHVQPFLGNDVEYIGEVGLADKIDLLGSSAALICPSRWPEPFGLVAIEGLACGTPVLASAFGAFPEIVEHGVHGFLCNDIDDFIDASGLIATIDPRACRERCETQFSARRMAEAYARLYAGIVADLYSFSRDEEAHR